MLTLTPAAILAVKTKLEKAGHSRLRIGVSGGAGCEGFALALSYEDREPSARDTEFLYDSVCIVIDAKSLALLMGATIDYEKTLMQEGFVLKSDKIQSYCSCGKSFVITK